MRVLLAILAAAVVLFPLTANATIINIPGGYPTIQEGINHGSDGDTVLVQPDTYYENLNFYGHNVVLASLFLMTGDTAYISSTVIDGDSAGSVICFWSGEDSTAQVVGFTIQNGRSDFGGGIQSIGPGPTIRNNIIAWNFARDSGGGIICTNYTHAAITDNVIRDNGAEFCGGGIYCFFCSCATIGNNTISDNWAGSDGGGIYLATLASLMIVNNTISGNSAICGGGIQSMRDSRPMIVGNTISGNSASYSGGGIECFDSFPTITNSILWQNTAPHGPQIYLWSGNATVTYCDVQGGWEGLGNIDADPIFVGAEREDFNIRWHSPCIDAGDPDFPLDPDGTRSDIGAFYFNQDVLGIVELYPHNTPIVIPPEGGEVVYDGWVFNTSDNPLTVDIRGYLYLDGAGRYHRVHKHKNVPIPVGDSVGQNSIVNTVPSFFPAGDYTLVAYIGAFPHTIIDSCYFYFTKTGSIGSGTVDGLAVNGWFREANPEGSSLPVDYSLFQNYPNPFNALTVIKYQLPVDGRVKLEVYNLFGQKVVTLVNSKQQAGYRSVSWDASSVSSGLYFYRLTAGDYTETRRMMLVK